MAIKKISANLLGSNAVLAANIAGGAISAADIADNSITAAKISTSTFAIDSLTVNTSDLVVDTANNRVGIGTTSPDANLEVSGTTSLPLFLTRKVNNVGVGTGIGFRLYDSANNLTNYASIFGTIEDNTDGAEDGALLFQTLTSNSLSEKMRIDSSGNVGIGTSSPASILHLLGTDPKITLGVSGAVERAFLQYDNTASLLSLDSDGAIRLSPNNTEALRINSLGNVGIGTDSPSYLLDVESVSGTDNILNVRNPSTSWGEYALARFQTDTKDQRFIDLGYYRGAAEAERAFIINGQSSNRLFTILESSGNVGIGTSSPSRKFVVKDTTTAHIKLTESGLGESVTDGLDLVIDYTGTGYLINRESASLHLGTSNTNRLSIDSSGNVGIGGGPAGPLSLHVNVTTGGIGWTNGFFIKNDVNTSGTHKGIIFGDSSDSFQASISGESTGGLGQNLVFVTRASGGSIGERMRIGNDGGVSVSNDGQMGYSGSKFHVKGTAFTTSDSSGNANGGFSTFSGNKDVSNSATTLFTLYRDNGAHSGFVIITKSESGDSASAIYSWASNYGYTPDLDLLSSATTGYTGFTLSASQNTHTTTFQLTHGAAGTKNYTYTVIYGGSRQSNVTVTLY